MSKLWEVDPETRSKLQSIQKTNDNNKCVDCGAPSPQWASPKFGIFFCLACSGTHRSLGVHISFVRSVTMDSFKNSETARMSAGGNKPWKDFFNAHTSNTMLDRSFDDCTISERYDSEAGEEWKERLTCKVEGTEYVPGTTASTGMQSKAKKAATSPPPPPVAAGFSGRNSPSISRVSSPPRSTAPPSQKSRNEAYFASKGAENASRPDDLAPNQGGKYAGFGSDPFPANAHPNNSGQAWEQDPVAALTKGFGWLSSTVTKQAASVNKSYLQPGLKQLQDGEAFAQAQKAAQQFGKDVQYGAKGMGEQFNRFVDPEHASRVQGGESRGDGPALSGRRQQDPERKDFWDSFGAPSSEGPPRERREFWDDFASAGDVRQVGRAGGSSIGTSALKTSGGSGSGNGGASGSGGKEDDGWGDW